MNGKPINYWIYQTSTISELKYCAQKNIALATNPLHTCVKPPGEHFWSGKLVNTSLIPSTVHRIINEQNTPLQTNRQLCTTFVQSQHHRKKLNWIYECTYGPSYVSLMIWANQIFSTENAQDITYHWYLHNQSFRQILSLVNFRPSI